MPILKHRLAREADRPCRCGTFPVSIPEIMMRLEQSHHDLISLFLSMIFSENRFPLFRIML